MVQKNPSDDPYQEELDENCCEVFGYALAGVSAFPFTLWVVETLGEYYSHYANDALE